MATWFDPVLGMLAGQPPDTTTVTLTLAALAALAGRPLPASATTPTYWQGHTSVRRRLAAIGWRTARAGRGAATIPFARLPGEHPESDSIASPLAAASPRASDRIMPLCRRPGLRSTSRSRPIWRRSLPLR